MLNLTEISILKSREGLVPKKITVQRNGKSYMKTVWVRAEDEKKERLRINHIEYESAANDFRRIQAASFRLSDEEVRAYHSASKELDEGLRKSLSGVLGRWLDCSYDGDSSSIQLLKHPKTGSEFHILPNVNPKLFHDVFQIVKQYLRSGDAVDLHDDYSDCRCFLSKDGLSGFAIEPDGNLVSVFSLRSGFLSAWGAYMVKMGAVKLDCFDSKLQSLPDIYKKTLGFELASKLKFDKSYLEKDKGKDYADWFVKTYGEADVLFMVRGENVKIKTFDDYDEAVQYRDSQLNL